MGIELSANGKVSHRGAGPEKIRSGAQELFKNVKEFHQKSVYFRLAFGSDAQQRYVAGQLSTQFLS